MSDVEAPKELRPLLAESPPSRLTTIVDVGANPVNEPPGRLLREIGACRIAGFEPEAKAFAALQKAKGPNEVYYNQAIGAGPHNAADHGAG